MPHCGAADLYALVFRRLLFSAAVVFFFFFFFISEGDGAV
jgi:hypothetical protein